MVSDAEGCIVLWTGSEEMREPNESCKSSGIKDLDNFIWQNYKTVQRFGPYIILHRAIDFS